MKNHLLAKTQPTALPEKLQAVVERHGVSPRTVRSVFLDKAMLDPDFYAVTPEELKDIVAGAYKSKHPDEARLLSVRRGLVLSDTLRFLVDRAVETRPVPSAEELGLETHHETLREKALFTLLNSKKGVKEDALGVSPSFITSLVHQMLIKRKGQALELTPLGLVTARTLAAARN